MFTRVWACIGEWASLMCVHQQRKHRHCTHYAHTHGGVGVRQWGWVRICVYRSTQIRFFHC